MHKLFRSLYTVSIVIETKVVIGWYCTGTWNSQAPIVAYNNIGNYYTLRNFTSLTSLKSPILTKMLPKVIKHFIKQNNIEFKLLFYQLKPGLQLQRWRKYICFWLMFYLLPVQEGHEILTIS